MEIWGMGIGAACMYFCGKAKTTAEVNGSRRIHNIDLGGCGKHLPKHNNFLVCQESLGAVEIWTLRPAASIKHKDKTSWYACRFW